MKSIKQIVLGFLFLFLAVSICVAQGTSPAKSDGKYTFHSDWFTHNIPNWNRILQDMKGKPGLTYLEIGPFEGRSFLWVMDNLLTHPSSRAIAIDTFDRILDSDPEQIFRENLRRSGHEAKVTIIKGYSQQKMRDLNLNSIDLIYIDGDHRGKGVLQDAILAWDLLKEDGLLIFDDYKLDYELPMEMRPEFSLDVLQSLFWDEMTVLVNDYQLIVRKTKSQCDENMGSIKRLGMPLVCSKVGHYIYYWKPKKLYDSSTKREITLNDTEISLLENSLVRRKLGFRLDVKSKEQSQYKNLFHRLGINEINVSSNAR
ncbi:MAG: hypothetical protein CVU54_15070 [Deltaproteobacteria bacterium HGW-Deltaproteobacteria-12]|jgi:hypothetical protein|nr:MAG: hypothetical protein CVU54_15070 [Deltaproteobacteria bacterium HGW-Deltaproteobacteria-12]